MTFLLSNIKIQANLGYAKSGYDYRQILKIDKQDFCSTMNDLSSYQTLKKSIEWVSSTFPGLIHKCPYTVSFSFLDFENLLTFYADLQNFQRDSQCIQSQWNNRGFLQAFHERKLQACCKRF